MPVTVAGAAGGSGPSEAEMYRDLDAAGVNGALLRALLEKYSLAQLWRGVQKGHTPQSLADLLAEAQGAGAAPSTPAAKPAAQRPTAQRPAAPPADPVAGAVAGWWDAALASGGWTILVGIVWVLNGLGTVVAVIGGVTNTLPATFAFNLNPYLAWGIALVVSVIAYLWLASNPARSLWVLVPALLGAGVGTAFVLTRPVTPVLIGWVLGLIVHLTISKTELLYWGALFSWRVIPLTLSVSADVLTSAQGLVTVAYRMGWNWVLGENQEALLPDNVLAWFGPVGILWRRFRSAGLPADQLPALPEWWGRAIVVMVVVAVVALGAERAFRFVWRDWTTTWSSRPWRRAAA